MGNPTSVHSENGTNFVGAENELNSLLQGIPKNQSFRKFNKDKNIDCRFQPPWVPRFRVAHESFVRSTKKALYRSLDIEKGSIRYPNYEILSTLLAEIVEYLTLVLLHTPARTHQISGLCDSVCAAHRSTFTSRDKALLTCLKGYVMGVPSNKPLSPQND
ncbi:hypothetical protein OUZ56_012296 [Daphnia magna]|uniref:Integrase catalytic domain-containing protein n=1 Tax=Daphnia magna TaxID=35525 RepID=A0ABQ9Z3W4_9CRUS|nr:hypothetical protein OUZ56_012296 [Daphnia magna]